MRARALVVAAPGQRPGQITYRTLRSDPPLLLRSTPDGRHLVGGAAGPLGGDDLDLEIMVEPGAHLRVRSVAASIVLPGDAPSDVTVRATVAGGARLDWAPEPVVSVRGSRHRQHSAVTVEPGGHLSWTETLVLGRSGEPGGTVDATLRIEREGRPLLHQQLGCGDDFDGWSGLAVLGSARVVSTTVTVGPPSSPPQTAHDEDSGTRGLSVPLGVDTHLVQAIGSDVPETDMMLASVTACRRSA